MRICQAVLLMVLLLAGPHLRAGTQTPSAATPAPVSSVIGTGDVANVSDFWRAVRGGQTGTIVDPRSQSGRLITDRPRDCAEVGNCTERAVGFTLPIHDLMPAVREPVGQGAKWQALVFVIGLFMALLVAGAVFIRVLGTER